MAMDNKIISSQSDDSNEMHSQQEEEVSSVSYLAELWRDFRKNKGAVLGLIILCLIIATAIVSTFLIDYETQIVEMNISEMFQKPSLKHWCGTDNFGRDIFLRLIYGTRYSLLIGVCSVMFSLLIGTTLGILAGYYGGVLEQVIMRISDVFSPIPSMLLAVCLTTAFGQGMVVLMAAIGVAAAPAFAQVARASVLTVREQEYIEAAKASGSKEYRIILRHVLPNALSPVLVQATLQVANAIVAASGLSFLGLGVPTPMPEWGAMLSEGRAFIRDYSYMTLFPGLAIMITVLAINMIGDGLRDAMDPKLKR